jgi:HD-GYP domain-containing protein (c-di-GMP phosphodiesterase class II)
MIIGESGTHFDPRIIEVFQDNLDDFKNAYDGFKSENKL